MKWPLPEIPLSRIPDHFALGGFGVNRKHDIHTGVDLYAPEGSRVVAVEGGTVVAVEEFTGFAESPWWNDTWAVLVEGASGVLCYGEIETNLSEGDELQPGQLIGHILTVLKKNKRMPRSMLHFEQYAPGTTETVWWKLGEMKPENLKDPSELLFRLIVKENLP